MKTYELVAEPRTELGKSATKKIRKQGHVPVAIYRKNGQAPVFASIRRQDLEKSFSFEDAFLYSLNVGGQTYQVVRRDSEFHPVFDHTLHTDFMEVNDREPITVEIPLKLVGRSKGELDGGKLVQKQRKLRVRGLYSKLPERVELNVTDLALGRSIKTGDLKFDDFVVMMQPDVALASVEITRALRQAASEAQKSGK